MGEIKFEKAIQRLEKIVDDLEKGEMDIDKSLEIFEEGIKMSRVCSKKLNEAEAKIEKLTKDQKGELVTELFPVEDENDQLPWILVPPPEVSPIVFCKKVSKKFMQSMLGMGNWIGN
jgi:exodeoxyribonuclease VII small subunit